MRRSASRRDVVKGATLLSGYVILSALPVILALVFHPHSKDGFLHNLGLGAGLTGFALLTLQAVLSSRIRLLSDPFGLDVVMQFHKGMALVAAVLLMTHPVLFALGSGSPRIFGLATSWRVNLGKAALLTLLLVVGLALFHKRFRVDYWIPRNLHKIVVVAIVLGFLHSSSIGPDLRFPGLRAYWWALFCVAIAIALYRNAFVPFLRRRFVLSALQQETRDTWTLTLAPESGPVFDYRPGQFLFLRLIGPGILAEEHPFTISSSPRRTDAITVTIKESGNYTRTIGRTPLGTRARLEAPFGRFSLAYYAAPEFVFIAGGVGITPVMSMLRYLRDTDDPRRAVLLYASRTREDIIFREELAALPPRMEVAHILSQPDADWPGLSGRLSAAILRERAGDRLARGAVFLCGPPPMIRQAHRDLRGLGVPARRVHFERFAL